MNRYTFVIHVHADGPSTLENLSTHELISVPDLAAVGPQIERWLAALPESPSRAERLRPAFGPQQFVGFEEDVDAV